MKAKFKLILGRRKDYPTSIELEVYKGVDCRVFISTGVALESTKQWDVVRQLVIKHSNAEQYNKFLRGIIDNIESAEADAEKHGAVFDATAIRAAAKNLTSFEHVDVIETFRKYIAEEKGKKGTALGHTYNVNVFEKFIKKFKGTKNARLSFGEFNQSVLVEFDKYLSEIIKPSTISQCHIVIRMLAKRAHKDGLIRHNPYSDFDFAHGKSERHPSLTSDNLSVLENVDRNKFKDKRINVMALDMYLFSCYTGLRYSDVSTLLKSEIIHDGKGLVIDKKTIKTGAKVLLPLYIMFSGKAQTIAERYLNEHEEMETLFPPMSSVSINSNLEKIEKFLKLPIHITFHTARHTCATQLAERVDNPFVIMDVLGHSKIQTSMNYIHHSQKSSEKKLAEVDWSDKDEIEYQSNERTQALYDSIVDVCNAKQLSEPLTSLAVGAIICNTQHADTIIEWISKLKKTDYSIEAFGKRLEMLVG